MILTLVKKVRMKMVILSTLVKKVWLTLTRLPTQESHFRRHFGCWKLLEVDRRKCGVESTRYDTSVVDSMVIRASSREDALRLAQTRNYGSDTCKHWRNDWIIYEDLGIANKSEDGIICINTKFFKQMIVILIFL